MGGLAELVDGAATALSARLPAALGRRVSEARGEFL